MAELNSILLSVLMILGSLVLVVLIFVLIRLSKSLRAVQEEITGLNAKLQPLIEQVTDVSEKTGALLEDLNAQKNILEASVARVRDIAQGLYDMYSTLEAELTPAVDATAHFLAKVRRGLETFFSALRAKR